MLADEAFCQRSIATEACSAKACYRSLLPSLSPKLAAKACRRSLSPKLAAKACCQSLLPKLAAKACYRISLPKLACCRCLRPIDAASAVTNTLCRYSLPMIMLPTLAVPTLHACCRFSLRTLIVVARCPLLLVAHAARCPQRSLPSHCSPPTRLAAHDERSLPATHTARCPRCSPPMLLAATLLLATHTDRHPLCSLPKLLDSTLSLCILAAHASSATALSIKTGAHICLNHHN